MGILRKLGGQTLIYGSSTILARLLNLAFTPLYTHIFPQEVYGIYINLYAYISFVLVVLTFGMETTFFRFIQDTDRPKEIYQQALIWVSTMVGAFLLLGGLLHPGLAAWMDYEGQEHLILMMLGIIALDSLAAVPLARLRQQERVSWFALITVTNVLVSLILNLVFVLWLRLGIEYVFVANLISSSVRLGLAFWRNLPNGFKPDFKLLQPMLHYAFFIMIAGFAGIMNETLDRIMIPFLWEDGAIFDGVAHSGRSLNGIYGANYKVAMLIALATQAFRYAVEPFFFGEAKKKDSPETFARIFHYFLIAALLGFLLIGSFAFEIVSFNFFGLIDATFVDEAYWSGVKVVPILLLAYVFSAAYINLSIWFKITKQTRFAILFTGTGAFITILVNYFGIPHYGYMASAWATLACYAVMCIGVYLVGQHYYPIPYRVKRLLVYAALFVLAFWVNNQIGAEGAWALVAKAFVCLLALGLVVVAEKYLPLFGTPAKESSEQH